LKSINIEKMMGHSIGISDSYYRVTEGELLEDYLKAVSMLTISSEDRLQKDLEKMAEQSKNNATNFELQLYEKAKAITILAKKDSMNIDAIASLSDKIQEMMAKIQKLEAKNK
jgi:hypothetical protein